VPPAGGPSHAALPAHRCGRSASHLHSSTDNTATVMSTKQAGSQQCTSSSLPLPQRSAPLYARGCMCSHTAVALLLQQFVNMRGLPMVQGCVLAASLPVLLRAAMAASYVFLLATIAPSALLIKLLSASMDSIC
jgi:hypothetical protein